MKRFLAVLMLSGMFFSACSTYTCPTYTKAPVEKESKAGVTEEQI